MSKTYVTELDGQAIALRLEALSRTLADCVESRAAIGFLSPFSCDDAACFWLHDVQGEVLAARRVLFIAERNG